MEQNKLPERLTKVNLPIHRLPGVLPPHRVLQFAGSVRGVGIGTVGPVHGECPTAAGFIIIDRCLPCSAAQAAQSHGVLCVHGEMKRAWGEMGDTALIEWFIGSLGQVMR